MKKQELEVKSKNELATASFDMASFVDGGLEKTDVRIQKLIVCQPMNPIKEEMPEIKSGDMFLSVSKEVGLALGEEIELIPLYTQKLWAIFKNVSKIPTYEGSKRGDWIETVQKNAQNKNWENITEEFIRDSVMAMYTCFLGGSFSSMLPTRVDFKKSSYSAFQVIAEGIEKFTKNNPGTSQLDCVFTLTVKKKTNKDNQTFYVLSPKFARQSTEEEKQQALDLFNFVLATDDSEKLNDADLTNYAE